MKNFETLDEAGNTKAMSVEDIKNVKTDPNSKYSRYVMDNYAVISFKVAIGVAMINCKVPEIYEWITTKLPEWRTKFIKKLHKWRYVNSSDVADIETAKSPVENEKYD